MWTIALEIRKVAEFGAHTRSRSLFLSGFSRTYGVQLHRGGPKVLCYFFDYNNNHGQDFGSIGASREPVFDLENGSTPASSSKKWVRSQPIDSLNKLFKELLRRLTRWHSLEIAPAAQ